MKQKHVTILVNFPGIFKANDIFFNSTELNVPLVKPGSFKLKAEQTIKLFFALLYHQK